MNFLKRSLVSLLCVAALLLARPAQSIPTTTTGGTVVLGGIVVLVLYVAKIGPFEVKDAGTKHVAVTPDEAAKLANVYLHELGPALTEAITSGTGPVVSDWAKTLKLPAEHTARFAALLHSNRVELLELSRLDALTDARAARFFERLSELVNADPLLQQDVQLLRASL